MTVQSNAPQCSKELVYLRLTCPICGAKNFLYINTDDITAPDIEVCLCHYCKKKFWLPQMKQLHEDGIGLGLDPEDDKELTEEYLGLKPGEDLIELGFCEEGLKSLP